jgi:hypothetical protein
MMTQQIELSEIRSRTEIGTDDAVISPEIIAAYEQRARFERAAALKALAESAWQWLSRSRQRATDVLAPKCVRQVNA